LPTFAEVETVLAISERMLVLGVIDKDNDSDKRVLLDKRVTFNEDEFGTLVAGDITLAGVGGLWGGGLLMNDRGGRVGRDGGGENTD